jgi:hypothetical protein
MGQRVVGKVVAYIAYANFKEATIVYQLVLKWLEIVNSHLFHRFIGFIPLILGPLGGNNQFFIHRKINHEKLKWIDAGHLAILELLKHYLFQMTCKLKVVSPVTARVLGLKQFDKSFGIHF